MLFSFEPKPFRENPKYDLTPPYNITSIKWNIMQTISPIHATTQRITIHKTEVIKNSLNVTWKPFTKEVRSSRELLRAVEYARRPV